VRQYGNISYVVGEKMGILLSIHCPYMANSVRAITFFANDICRGCMHYEMINKLQSIAWIE